MDGILGILYVILGYWAMGATVYANKIRIGTASDLFFSRLVWGIVFGWILIPIAILKVILFKR